MISEEIWYNVKQNITRYPYLEGKIDMLSSNQRPDLLSKLIVDILDSVQDDK